MENNTSLKVFIADDHPMFIDGLKLLLKDEQHIRITDHAVNGLEVLEKLKQEQPDLLIMDINMPRMDGIETLKRIRAYYPGVRVLILSTYNEQSFVDELVRTGASGFITKNTGKQDLFDAIHTIASGKTYFKYRRSGRHEMNAIESSDLYLKLKSLTPREKDILRLITSGKLNKEISAELFLSILTVETHRKNIQRKLNAKNTADLVRMGIRLEEDDQ